MDLANVDWGFKSGARLQLMFLYVRGANWIGRDHTRQKERDAYPSCHFYASRLRIPGYERVLFYSKRCGAIQANAT